RLHRRRVCGCSSSPASRRRRNSSTVSRRQRRQRPDGPRRRGGGNQPSASQRFRLFLWIPNTWATSSAVSKASRSTVAFTLFFSFLFSVHLDLYSNHKSVVKSARITIATALNEVTEKAPHPLP